MNVGDVGEFGLIERLRRMVEEASVSPHAAGFRLHIGIGDDAAAWLPGTGTEICTTDTMVQGVHFTPQTTSWTDVGWKLMAANLSDIAAMGGIPLYALVTLGLPSSTPVSHVEGLYQGMLEACRRYQAGIVGGDVVASPVAFVTVALTGVCLREPLTRSSARPGDVVAVTGALGASAMGLAVLQEGLRVAEPARARLVEAHRRPTPALAEGQSLAATGIRCAMDVSDGLVDDLGKLCLASGVAATVVADSVPVLPEVKEAAPGGYIAFVLNGGEDYALLFAGPEATVARALKALPAHSAIIGHIVEGRPGHVAVVDALGAEVPVGRAGWDHFRSP